MKQKITVLGSTGSIGKNTLDVVARHPDRYEVFALSAATQVDLMLEQCAQFKPRFAVMASAPHAQLLAEKIKQNGLPTSVLQAQDALEIIASHESVDAVMAAIVGAAGLAPCLAAARAGKRLLLANKEALVVGGEIGDQFRQQRRESLDRHSLHRYLRRFPWMTAKTALAIYWQALRLLLKRAPIFAHQTADGSFQTATVPPKEHRHEIL